jgi:hypothetical protein
VEAKTSGSFVNEENEKEASFCESACNCCLCSQAQSFFLVLQHFFSFTGLQQDGNIFPQQN